MTISYGYDADGLRRTRAVNGGATSFLWSAASNNVVCAMAAGMAVSAGGARLGHDGPGSVVGLVGGMSTVRKYDAWGGFQENTVPNPSQPALANAGQAFDADSGPSYAQQRWYDAGAGRFLTMDLVNRGA